MNKIPKVKKISIWIFIVPFLGINICLLLVNYFHGLFPDPTSILHNSFPYIDGSASISRTARIFPSYLVFKPAMFLTSFLLIKYWFYNKEIILFFKKDSKHISKFIFFGIGSAILLTLHSIFLGVKFDYDVYKLFRRVVMLGFVIFEVIAQTYLVISLYSIKKKILKYINYRFLIMKFILVSVLIIVAFLSIPIVATEGHKSFKHLLEWNYFLSIIFFYLLTFCMWKKK